MSELLATLVFVAAIAVIVSRFIDETSASLLAVVLMVVLTEYTPEQAFHYIDWNVIAILFGMWVITGYMIEGGVAQEILRRISSRVSSYRRFLMALAFTAGILSMFVDNVLVIILFGTLAIRAAKQVGGDPVLAVLLVGFSANFMGTALLMGDLPPQLLHSVAGAEFMDFIWSQGRPSSFPLLLATFIITLGAYYYLFVRKEPDSPPTVQEEELGDGDRRLLLVVSTLFFVLTVTGMALRPLLGYPLGFITVAGAAALSVTVELLRRAGRGMPGFEKALDHVEWRALLFYAALFALVGGLEETGVLARAAEMMVPYIQEGGWKAYTVAYWVVGLLALVVEHDALLLTFLYIVRDAAAAAGFDPWPLYWAMAWSATLASNATTAAAPALYVAVTIAEEEGYRVTARKFLKYSLAFAGISLIVHYLITLPVWGGG